MGENLRGVSSLYDGDGDNSAQAMKTTPGVIWVLEVQNPNSVDSWLQLYDVAAGSVTVGTTTPKQSYLIPAGDGTRYGGFLLSPPVPLRFYTAITYACTTAVSGSGDPSTGLILNAWYE